MKEERTIGFYFKKKINRNFINNLTVKYAE